MMHKPIPSPIRLVLASFLLGSSLLALTLPLAAQQKAEPVDEMFRRARQEAFAERYEEARRLCRMILERTPEYHDVRILLARTWAWEEHFEKARRELRKVLADSPRYRDALNALGDVEYWSENYQTVTALMDEALGYYPAEADFLVRKIRAHLALQEYREGALLISRLERLYPAHPQLANLREQAGDRHRGNRASASYGYEYHPEIFGQVHTASLSLERYFPRGSLTGSLEYLDRTGGSGVQVQFTAYPVIYSGFYAYLNYGYSGSGGFPEHRAGAELYHRLPSAFEISLGARYLKFPPGESVVVFTGSLSRYFQSYYLRLNAYLTPRSSGTARSISMTVRRYLSSPDHYLYLRGTWGVTPRERTYQAVSAEVFMLKSRGLAGGVRTALSEWLTFTVAAEYDYRELLFRPGSFAGIVRISSGLEVRF